MKRQWLFFLLPLFFHSVNAAELTILDNETLTLAESNMAVESNLASVIPSRKPHKKEIKTLVQLHECKLPLGVLDQRSTAIKAIKQWFLLTPVGYRNTLTRMTLPLSLWGIRFAQMSVVGGDGFFGVAASSYTASVDHVLKQLNARGYRMMPAASGVSAEIAFYQSTRFVGGIKNTVTLISGVANYNDDRFDSGVTVSCTTVRLPGKLGQDNLSEPAS
jgi:hypothetical protein